jgi:hypothetical protein
MLSTVRAAKHPRRYFFGDHTQAAVYRRGCYQLDSDNTSVLTMRREAHLARHIQAQFFRSVTHSLKGRTVGAPLWTANNLLAFKLEGAKQLYSQEHLL